MIGLVKEPVSRVSLVFAAALFAVLVGCAHKKEPTEAPKAVETPKATSSAKPANEIPLRDPDVVNELPDERIIGAAPRTIGAGGTGPETGTVIARPPRSPAPASAPPQPSGSKPAPKANE